MRIQLSSTLHPSALIPLASFLACACSPQEQKKNCTAPGTIKARAKSDKHSDVAVNSFRACWRPPCADGWMDVIIISNNAFPGNRLFWREREGAILAQKAPTRRRRRSTLDLSLARPPQRSSLRRKKLRPTVCFPSMCVSHHAAPLKTPNWIGLFSLTSLFLRDLFTSLQFKSQVVWVYFNQFKPKFIQL